jgi:UDP-glucose 4-epimerase
MQDRRAGDPSHLVADAAKARDLLGWQPQHTKLAAIISSAWEWNKE